MVSFVFFVRLFENVIFVNVVFSIFLFFVFFVVFSMIILFFSVFVFCVGFVVNFRFFILCWFSGWVVFVVCRICFVMMLGGSDYVMIVFDGNIKMLFLLMFFVWMILVGLNFVLLGLIVKLCDVKIFVIVVMLNVLVI